MLYYLEFLQNYSHTYPIYLQRWDNYNKFLQSRQWSEKRRSAYEYWGNMCFQCSNKAECIHHINYFELWGDEDVAKDLIPLCNICHENNHKYFVQTKFTPSLIYNDKVKERLSRCSKI